VRVRCRWPVAIEPATAVATPVGGSVFTVPIAAAQTITLRPAR
jgi:hypothetical protein